MWNDKDRGKQKPDGPIVVNPQDIGRIVGSVTIESADGESVDLPKYDIEGFEPVDRVKVPVESRFVDTGDLTYKVAVDLARGRVPMLWGPAGVGKTYLARHMAYLMGLPFERIPLGETSEREDVTGHYELRGSETVWVESRLARSFTRPGVTCIDEWNAAPLAVLHVARPILDDSHQLALDAWDGRILLKHDHAFMVATGNPDWLPQYAGLMPLGEADGDRLSHIDVGWPELMVEASIVKAHAIDKGLTAVPAWHGYLALRVWTDLREAIKEERIHVSAGTRGLLNFVECLQYHDARQAMAKVYQRMDPRQYKELEGFLDHHNWGLKEQVAGAMLVDAEVSYLVGGP